MGIMGMMAMHFIRVAKATNMGQHLALVCAACFSDRVSFNLQVLLCDYRTSHQAAAC